MLKYLLVFVLALAICLPVRAGDVNLSAAFKSKQNTTAERVTYTLAMIGIVADWRTTREFGKYYYTPSPTSGVTYYENGPLLKSWAGKYPSSSQVNLHFIAIAGALTYLQFNNEWNKSRLLCNSIFALSYLLIAHHNVNAGIELRF